MLTHSASNAIGCYDHHSVAPTYLHLMKCFFPLLRLGVRLLVPVGNTNTFFLFFATAPPFLHFSIYTGVGVEFLVLGFSVVTLLTTTTQILRNSLLAANFIWVFGSMIFSRGGYLGNRWFCSSCNNRAIDVCASLSTVLLHMVKLSLVPRFESLIVATVHSDFCFF
jgi:hypothetical protein